MNTATAIRNNAIIILDFFEPINGFVNYPAEDQQGKKQDKC
jgi:hypothetical protein